MKLVKTPTGIVFVIAAMALLSPRPSSAQPYPYVIEDLGTLPGDASSLAMGINAAGDVVGWSISLDVPGGPRAFVYTAATGMIALPGLPDRPRTLARDINDFGDIVGTADAGGLDIGHAVLWSNGTVQDLGTLGIGTYSEAWGINNSGEIVGSSSVSGGSFGVHAFLYTQSGGMVDLTPNSDAGYALDINDAGQVTGYKTAFGGYHAFRWQEGTFLDLGVLPDFAHSFGYAINASGQVAGSSTTASGSSERFVRHTDGAPLQNLGGTGEHNVGFGINAAGDVVGTRGEFQARAHLYTDAGGLRDLNSLIDPAAGWLLLSATDINDSGQIVGRGFVASSAEIHAYRLTPSAQAPPVQIALFPRSATVAPGQALDYDVAVTNVSGSGQTFDVWIDALLPSGNQYSGNPLIGPATATLPAGGAVRKTLSLRVPARVRPSGPYTIRGSVGDFPNVSSHLSSFQFFVQ